METERPTTYPNLETAAALAAAREDLAILAGDIALPDDVTMRDVAGTAAANCRVLAGCLDRAYNLYRKENPCDFYLIAAVIREAEVGEVARGRIAQAFTMALKGSNPRFDPERFERACGLHPAHLVKRSGEGTAPTDGPTWDNEALQRDFEVLGFAAPFVVVKRRSDGALGSLEFTHVPRTYFNFVVD